MSLTSNNLNTADSDRALTGTDVVPDLVAHVSFDFRLMVAASTVINPEGFLTIVASPAILAGVQILHGYLYRSLLHLGEDFRVVAVGTGQPGILVRCPVENDRAHRRVPPEFQRFARPDGKSGTDRHNRQHRAQCRNVLFHGNAPFFSRSCFLVANALLLKLLE